MASDNSLESALDASLEQDVKTGEEASTSQDQDVNPAASSDAEDVDGNKPSESSSDEGVKDDGPTSLEEMIGKSIDEVTKAPAEDSPPEEQSDQDQDGKDDKPSETENTEKEDSDAESDELSDEEKTASDDWRNSPATKKVLTERKKARAERDEFKQKFEHAEQEAGQFRQIRQYLDDGKVSDQDAANALQMARLWRENPQAMFQELERMRSELGTQLGAILPNDLQSEVDQGLISPERATELAKARGDVQLSNAKVEQATQEVETNTAEQESQYRVQLFQNWADQISQTDPGLQQKLPLITAKMSHYLATEGDPGSPQAAWDRLTRAHQEVTEGIQGFLPPKVATKKSPRSSGLKVASTAPPSTFDEVMSQAIDDAMSGSGG